MVLKSIVRYIINKYLKDYIERLDDEKLKVDLKHGLYGELFVRFEFFLF